MDNLPRADEFQVNVKTLKNIAAVACVAALAVPAGVSAKGPSEDHGKSGKQKTSHVNKKCKKQPQVGFSIQGTLADGSTATAIVVNVTKVSKHGRSLVTDGKYTVPEGAKVSLVGTETFPTADFATYRVKVNGKTYKYKKGCNEENTPQQKVLKTVKVKIHAPQADEQEAPKQDPPAGS